MSLAARRRRAPLAALALAVALLPFAGCGKEEEERPADEAPAEDAAEREAGEPTSRRGGGRELPVVEVSVDEERVSLPGALPVGEVRFVVRNVGSRPHGFVLEGQDVEVRVDGEIEPGKAAEVEAKLEPGSYTAYCPLRGHKRGVPQLIVASERARIG